MSESFGEKIKKWCMEDGIFKQEIIDHEKYSFCYMIEYFGMPLMVYEQKSHPDTVYVHVYINIPEEYVKKIHDMENKMKYKFAERLTMYFISRVEFHIEWKNSCTPISLEFYRRIFYESLDRQEFFKAVWKVGNVLSGIKWIFTGWIPEVKLFKFDPNTSMYN